MWGLEGRPVLVTGASGGIGGATVRQLVAAGADVIASARSKAALADLAAQTGCKTLAFDLISEDSVREALGACPGKSGFWWRRGRESDSACS